MRYIKVLLSFLIVTITCSISFAYVIDSEFDNPAEPSDSIYAKWVLAGSNAVIDSVFIINVCAIPDTVTYYSLSDSTHYHIPHAVPDDEADDSFTFTKLVIWMEDNITIHGIHAQIYIPPGVYNFSDQIEMFSNISLKGAGSHQTELRFLIVTDSTMTASDCKKDAILVAGLGTQPAQRIRNVGIEDIKIVRIREGLTKREVKEKVGNYANGYWGNNIAIRRATDCWVKGVESENTFRNHVTLEYANHSKYQTINYTKVDR